jgi:hypothetical protein
VFEDEGQWIELRERFERQEIEALVDLVFDRITVDQPKTKPSKRTMEAEDHDRATIVRTVLALWELVQVPSHEQRLILRCLGLPEDPWSAP